MGHQFSCDNKLQSQYHQGWPFEHRIRYSAVVMLGWESTESHTHLQLTKIVCFSDH